MVLEELAEASFAEEGTGVEEEKQAREAKVKIAFGTLKKEKAAVRAHRGCSLETRVAPPALRSRGVLECPTLTLE